MQMVIKGVKVAIILSLILTSLPAFAANEPIINDVIPIIGPVGAEIIISGSNLGSPTDVKFNSIKATVSEQSATNLRVRVPNGATNGQITVTTANGTVGSPNNFTVTTPIPSNNGAIGKGDRIRLKTAMTGFEPTESKCFGRDDKGKPKSPVDAKSQYYAPADSVLTLNSDAYTDANSVRKVNVSFRGCRLFASDAGMCIEPDNDCNERVVAGNQYSIPWEKLEKTAIATTGFDYGTLLIPFKYQLHDHSITGNATIGQYIGYKFAGNGVSIMPVISAGLGAVTISNVDSQQTTTTRSVPSLSISYGIIFNIAKNGLFQAGILTGKDWTGKNNQYAYEGRQWISFSIGTNWTY